MGIAGNCFPRRGTGNIDFKNMSSSLDDKEDSLRSIWSEAFMHQSRSGKDCDSGTRAVVLDVEQLIIIAETVNGE